MHRRPAGLMARKKSGERRDYLLVDEASEIDDEAGRILSDALPRGWIDSPFHKKDYAKDHHIEVTIPAPEGEPGKKVTGKAFYVQRKGVDGGSYLKNKDVLAYELELHHLTYWADEAP